VAKGWKKLQIVELSDIYSFSNSVMVNGMAWKCSTNGQEQDYTGGFGGEIWIETTLMKQFHMRE
jgi:hypothetical protein